MYTKSVDTITIIVAGLAGHGRRRRVLRHININHRRRQLSVPPPPTLRHASAMGRLSLTSRLDVALLKLVDVVREREERAGRRPAASDETTVTAVAAFLSLRRPHQRYINGSLWGAYIDASIVVIVRERERESAAAAMIDETRGEIGANSRTIFEYPVSSIQQKSGPSSKRTSISNFSAGCWMLDMQK